MSHASWPPNETVSYKQAFAAAQPSSSSTGNYWRAAGALVSCDFCGAGPMEPCGAVDVTLPNGRVIERQVKRYRGTFHMGRTYAGHQVLRQMLEVGGATQEARQCPPPEQITIEDVVEIVEVTVARVVADATKPARRPTKSATRTTKRAPS